MTPSDPPPGEAQPPVPPPAQGPPAPRRGAAGRNLLALAALAVLVGTAVWGYRQQEFLRLNERGAEALRTGDFAGAEGAFRRALEIQPALHTLRLNLGISLEAQGKWAEAAAEYGEVLRETRSPKVDLYRQRCLCAAGDFRQPLTWIFDFRLSHPQDREAVLAEGECRLRSGDVEGALGLLEHAVALGAGPQAKASLERARASRAAAKGP